MFVSNMHVHVKHLETAQKALELYHIVDQCIFGLLGAIGSPIIAVSVPLLSQSREDTAWCKLTVKGA